MTAGGAAGRWLAVLGDRIGAVVVSLAIVMAILLVGAAVLLPKPGGRIISGDAIHHYVQLRSMVYDRDLDFSNEYTRIYRFDHPDGPAPDWATLLPTPTGRVRNYMPVGPAILWAPLYLAVSAVLAVAASAGLTRPPDGFEPVLQLVPGVTGVFLAAAGAWLTWRLAAKFTDRTSAAVGMLGVWLGSNALYYSLVSPSYSHSASMCATSLLVAHWIGRRDRWSVSESAVSGALVGVAALMRWQDALWLVIPAIECGRWPRAAAARLAGLAAAGAGFVVAFSPQLAVWQVLYGRPFTVPQGSGFMEWFDPNLVDVLVSKHGLFVWSPILVIAVFALVPFLRRHRELALPLGAVVLISWYVNGAVADWWAGEAFGARRFLSLFPIFVIGMAWWARAGIETHARRVAIVVLAFIVANGLLLFQYQLFMRGWRDIAPYPDTTWVDMWLVRFVVPFRVIARWIG